MEFGLGSRKKNVEERYPNNAVVTLPALEEGKRTRILFNTKAYEVMGLTQNEENEVAFSSDMENNLFIINANNYDSSANLTLRKNSTIANKIHYKAIKSIFFKNENEELNLEITETTNEFDGKKIYQLVLFKPTETQDKLITQKENIE